MSQRLKDNFYNLVTQPDFADRRNSISDLQDAMRTAKTHDVITYMMPYVIKETNKQWLILTSPLLGIISEKELLTMEMCSLNGAVYCNDFRKIKKLLLKGKKVVTYITNATAYTQGKLVNFLKEIDPSSISIWADEIDTWGVSHASLMQEVKGYKAQPDKYKASFYTTMSEIAKHTAYCFSFTATESFEFQGKVETFGDLKYYSVNPLKEGEQAIHAPYVAHFGGAYFFSNTDNPLFNDKDTTKETIGLMIKNNLWIQNQTNLKRSMMIGCGMDTVDAEGKRTQYGKAPNPDQVIEMIKSHNKHLKPDFEGCVLTGDRSFTFDRNGKTIANDLEPLDIQDRLNDMGDPLKMLLVKNMGGRGVTYVTVKDIMLLKVGDASTPYGQSTETPHQFIGRGKSILVGPSEVQEKFYQKESEGGYGIDWRNVPGYNQLANTYFAYCPDIKRMRETIDTHKRFDACTPDMLGIEHKDFFQKIQEICPCCNGTGYKCETKGIEFSGFDGIDKELGI